jgi:hypothetical protein
MSVGPEQGLVTGDVVSLCKQAIACAGTSILSDVRQ